MCSGGMRRCGGTPVAALLWSVTDAEARKRGGANRIRSPW